MKIKNYTFEATIPTCMYGNLKPHLEMEGTDIREMTEFGLDLVKNLNNRFSDFPLKETTQSIQENVKIKSFNEDIELDFNPATHEYKCGDKSLLSGSVYASSFYKRFDSQGIAKNCEKTWGVKAKDIVDMWDSNGSVTSSFGTAIHKALEHYDKHKNTAIEIEGNLDNGENKALPKHPILRSIIEGFMEIDQYDGDVETEVLVTDIVNSRCGLIDRLLILDKDKKVCRVQDYKINVDSETENKNLKALAPYDTLPMNKLTKYQIQLSFYANILQQNGWIVEGIDIYVLEDVWKHYQLDILDTYVEN